MEVDLACLECRAEGLRVHVGQHQHAAVCGVLNDRGQETVWAEADLGRGHRHAATAGTSRTGRPASAIAALTDAIEWIRRWKIDAARTASAPPSTTAATKSSGPAAPPDAITGTRTRDVIARSSAVSYPDCVPSRSIEVTSSSPAPMLAARTAQ